MSWDTLSWDKMSKSYLGYILYKLYTNVEEHRQSGAKNLKSGRGAGEQKLNGSGIETFFWLLNAEVCQLDFIYVTLVNDDNN